MTCSKSGDSALTLSGCSATTVRLERKVDGLVDKSNQIKECII